MSFLLDFRFYFVLGWQHIISRYALDHQLFILALCCVYRTTDLKRVLILVTAFTLGHSLTLALSVLDVIRFSTRWVEFLIPCTILVTAATNITQLDRDKRRVQLNYYFAMAFGLIHGMGFANAIRMVMAHDQHLASGLLGFNLGLEAGQIAVVSLILTLSVVFLNFMKVRQRDWILFLSAGVCALSLKMVLERLPF